MTGHVLVLLVSLITAPAAAWAQTMTFTEFTPDPLRIDPKTGTALSIAGLAEELKVTIGQTFGSTYRPDHERVYVAVHIVKWSDPVTPLKEKPTDSTPEPVQRVEHSRWYVYSNEGRWSADDFQTTNRLFGVNHLWVVAMHLNLYVAGSTDKLDRLATYKAEYKVEAVARAPSAIQNLTLLASLFPGLPAPGGAGAAPVVAAANRLSLWSARHVPVPDPSDITVTPRLKVDDFGKEDVPLGTTAKFDNEGRSRFDFGIAVPIRKASDLEAGAAGAGATPKVVSKSNAFATAALYLKPVDIKSTGLGRPPHIVLGVSITDHPLKNFMIGGGWGPAIANFFGAWKWTKLETPAVDGREWDGQVIFGVELPVAKALISKLKK